MRYRCAVPGVLAVLMLCLVAVVAWAAKQVPGVSEDRRVIFEDNDWRRSGSVVSAAGIEYLETPELLLRTRFERPVSVLKPTDDETLTCLQGLGGKLYFGTCTTPTETATGSVCVYDPDTDGCTKVYQVNEEGINRIVADGDRLYIPGLDANDGDWDLGNIYVCESGRWQELRTVPRAIHIYDLAVYRGRIYVSADTIDPWPKGMTVRQAYDGRRLKFYGRVLSSGDGGQTWREEYRQPNEGQEVGRMTVFKDQLVLNSCGDLVVFDGKRWTPMNLMPADIVAYDYGQEGDILLISTPRGLYYFDGRRLWASECVRPLRQARAMCRYRGRWIFACYWQLDSLGWYGPAGTMYPQLGARGKTIQQSEIWMIPTDAIRRSGHSRSGDIGGRWIVPSTEYFASVCSFRGRVYFGTHPSGRLMVLPVAGEGRMLSRPHRVSAGGVYHLTWDASTPPGTTASIRVRISPDKNSLARQPFVIQAVRTQGTPGDGAVTLTIPQPGFVQYELSLKTSDTARTPYVKRVALSEASAEQDIPASLLNSRAVDK